MILEFDKSFDKSLDRITDKTIFPKLKKIIFLLEEADSLTKIPNSKKLSGYKTYYRIRLGDYRLGFEKINENTVRFIVIAHRKDIYKTFP